MSEVFDRKNGRGVRLFAILLALLSLLDLGVTAWILMDLQHELEIVDRIVQHLPESDMARARELTGTLQLQLRLSVLLTLNIFGTAIAFAFVVRAYLSSEQSLRDAKVLAADIRASLDAAIITTDRQGNITSINPQGNELVALNDDWIGRPLADLDAEHQLLETIRGEVSRQHKSVRDREYRVQNQGHMRTLRAGCTLLRNQRGDEIGTVVHVSDVTEKALMEDRLRRMERYMGLGSLAAGLQHEIKNPLSALSLHVQLLRELLSSDSSAYGDHRSSTQMDEPELIAQHAEVDILLDVLRDEMQRINSVLDGFGNYATMNQLGRSAVDIQFLIDKLTRLLRPQASQQDVSISIHSPSLTLPLVQADSVRLEQVLLNLTLNALAAMPQGGKLEFRLDHHDQKLEIVVADTGHGIPPEIQAQIFDPYFTTRHDGTGMGLALCEKIVRQHDGTIDFKTGFGGTEFRILLPLESSNDT